MQLDSDAIGPVWMPLRMTRSSVMFVSPLQIPRKSEALYSPNTASVDYPITKTWVASSHFLTAVTLGLRLVVSKVDVVFEWQ